MVDLSFLLCSLGATSAASRYIAEYRHDPTMLAEFVRRWQPFALSLPLLASFAALAGARWSGMEITFTAQVMLAAWTVANGLWAMQTSALMGMQRFDLIFKANVLVAVILLAGAMLAPLGGDLARVFALMAGACASGSMIGSKAKKQLIGRNIGTSTGIAWREKGGYAINMWIAALIASQVWSRGEFPIVKATLGDFAIAHYAAALAIYGAAVQAIMLGVGGVAPHLTNLWGMGRKKEAIVLARVVMDLQLVVAGFASLIAILFAPEIVSLAFSAAYRDAAGPLSILSFAFLSFVVSSQSHLLQLATNGRFNRNSTILGLIVLYVLALMLIPIYGLQGAAGSRIGAMLLVSLFTVIFTARRWGKNAISMRNFVIVFGISVAALIFQTEMRSSSIVAKIPVLAFGVALLVAFLRDADGNMVIHSMLLRLKGRFARFG